MSRRGRPFDNQAVSLFPFLAVLLCTMGALVVLLVVTARQARARAEAARQAIEQPDPPAPLPEADKPTPDAGESVEELQAISARLEEVREQRLSELQTVRGRLSHAESHIVAMQDELLKLQREAQRIEELETVQNTDRQHAEDELQRLKELAEETEAEIAAAKKEMSQQKKSFSLIPYQGRHATQRRPLFIECTKEGLVLQPEGIEISEEDLAGPLGPGNPLAAALRAADEYFRHQANQDTLLGNQPYPLLVVRPGGIEYYYLARRAIEGWGTEFGYELINDEWDLSYPNPDPKLAQLELRAIHLARARQQALVAAAPRRFASVGLGAAPAASDGEGWGNGFAGEGGRSGGESSGSQPFARDSGQLASTRYAARPRDRNRTQYPGAPPSGRRSEAIGGSHGDGYSSQGIPGRRPEVGAGGAAGQSADTYGQLLGEENSRYGSTPSAEQGRHGSAHGELEAFPGETEATSAIHREAGEGSSQGNLGQPGGQQTGDPSAEQGFAGTVSQGASGSTASQAASQSFGASSGGQSSGQGGTPSVPQLSASAAPQESAPASTLSPEFDLSKQQQAAAWNVPKTKGGAVPMRRAIYVLVRRDRLAVLPENGAGGGRLIPFGESSQRTFQQFGEAISQRIREWGMAGSGMYWQPFIVLRTGPEAAAEAALVKQILQGQGIEVTGERRR